MFALVIVSVHAATNPGPAPGPDFNTEGIIAWMVSRLVPVILAILGLVVIAGARKGKFTQVANTGIIVVCGLFFIFGAGALVVFGQQLVHLALGGTA